MKYERYKSFRTQYREKIKEQIRRATINSRRQKEAGEIAKAQFLDGLETGFVEALQQFDILDSVIQEENFKP